MAVFGRKDEEKLICHSDLGHDELIHVDCVSHVYPDGSLGIHNLCFKVREREIVAVCGGNGSGKSTLLEHLNGLLNPSDGCVSVLGRRVDEKTKKYLWKDVGIVFQRAEDQLFAPTVLDDVMFGPLNMGLSVDEAKKVAMESLKAVGAEELVSKMPNYLSGGQKRLVSIAGVFAMKPKVIAMDEPTSDLDPNHSEIIENIIFEMKNKYGISIVIATHDLDLAARIADRICVVKNGSIIAEGTPAEIFYNEALLEEAGLRKPKIVQIYDEYCQSRGLARMHRPVTLPELAECFREG
ncbi:MAG: ATP-binding cassette domain-containing protein [Methanothrix sp.]|nr:MAG: ATP-binding cassette domain-containing protein [Methanothrix sp.]